MGKKRDNINAATRARWLKMWDGLEEKNRRQAQSIERLLAMTMIGVNALTEIRDNLPPGFDPHEVARVALEKIEAEREADRNGSTGNPEESTEGEEPPTPSEE